MKYNRFFDTSSDVKLVCSCGCGLGTLPGDLDEVTILIVTCARIHFGKPAIITSGPRCPRYNEKVGGKSGSYHLPKGGKSSAIDFYIKGVPVKELYNWLNTTFPGRYGMGMNERKGFVHVDSRSPGKRFDY